MRGIKPLAFELLFLWRYGFVYAYLFVLAVYAGFILAVPAGNGRILLALGMIYSDISMLGFIFMGASLHLEYQSGVIEALGVTPRESWKLIVRRSAAMSLVATLIASVLFLLAGGPGAGFPLFVVGALSCSATFTCFGISLMTRSGNLARYILLAGLLTLPAGIPILHLFGLLKGLPLHVLPGAGALVLMEAGAAGPGDTSLVFAVINIIIWGLAGIVLAARDFQVRLVEGRRAHQGRPV